MARSSARIHQGTNEICHKDKCLKPGHWDGGHPVMPYTRRALPSQDTATRSELPLLQTVSVLQTKHYCFEWKTEERVLVLTGLCTENSRGSVHSLNSPAGTLLAWGTSSRVKASVQPLASRGATLLSNLPGKSDTGHLALWGAVFLRRLDLDLKGLFS